MLATAETTATIRGAVTRLSRRLRAERPPAALSGNKVSVLSYLHRNGPSAPGVVAAAEHQQPQSLTRTFTELQLAGLVTRMASDHDRRASVLTITAAGRDALTRDMADRDAWLTEALGPLTDTETDLLRLAAALMNRLADSSAAVRRPVDQDRTA